ncbi:hypothetical protein [Halomarina ordinaria]|uniref:Integral membrane protein n=1 Tax=Halomarina ordinaria TaxID=3033939 RepID=A0ABD5U3L5_9EURY|nr:hypothetical protein [Halomarina sp. PSRA2]
MSAEREERRFDPWGTAVGVLVGLAGALVLAQPLGPFSLAGRRVMPMVLSTVALTAGFALGAVVYHRRGRRFVALAHGVGALGWGLVVLAAGVGSVLVLFVGFAVVLGGTLFLVSETRRR